MFETIFRKLRFMLRKKPQPSAGIRNEPSEPQEPPISADLEQNLNYVRQVLGTENDVIIHEFCLGSGVKAALVFVDGMVSSLFISESILSPLLLLTENEKDADLKTLQSTALSAGEISQCDDFAKLFNSCLSGDTALLVQGQAQSLIISTKGWERRGVDEPQTEAVVRGPREGFTENLRTNTALLRRRIKSKSLRLEQTKVGRRTQTNLCLAYLEDVVSPKVLEEVKFRLDKIDVDSILDSGNIEQYIEDAPFSVFSTVGYSEKPDVVAAKILEGRVGILVDGSPFVLTVPMLFIESFQSPEDYYVRTFYASITRLLRYLAYIITVFGPAVYIALVTFHQELIPTKLLFTIANAREGTPFTAFVEALIMVLAFEILREAGLRLPRPVGQAISIVGALIMGDAAVSAGLVGAPMVITIAITAVASFMVPNQNDSASLIRVPMMILAATMGGFGLAMGALAILVHLATLKSFGVAYSTGMVPLLSQSVEDSYIRMPLWSMVRRPVAIARGDIKRRQFFVPPAQKDEEGKAP